MKWSDIDFINGVIHITKTVSWKMGGGIEITSPKSKTSSRDIPLNDTIKKILKSQQEKVALLYGDVYARKLESNIFIGEREIKPVRSTTVVYCVKKIIKRLEKQGIYMEPFMHHAFRDTFATRFIEEGGNMQTLKTILGHSSLAMTADLYAHVLPNTKQQEMNLIEGAFTGVAD